MNEFNGWQEFSADGATVAFYKTTDGEYTLIGFDSRECVPPGPMVNAMVALNLINDKKTKVVMINHRFPVGLIPKIEAGFTYEQSELEDGGIKLVFSPKDGEELLKFDASQMGCKG